MAANFSLFHLDRSAVPVYQYTSALTDNLDSIMNLYDDARPYFYNFYPIPNFNKESGKLTQWHKIFSILNTKYLVVPAQDPPRNKKYQDITQIVSQKYNVNPNGQIWELSKIRSRFAFIPNGLLYIGGGGEDDKISIENIRKIISDEKFDLNKYTIFKGESGNLSDYLGVLKNFKGVITRETKFPRVTDSDDSITNYVIKNYKETPSRLEIKFNTNKSGFFVYSNTYYPGWEAKLNGTQTKVFMADSVVKGIIVPSGGSYDLVMEYKPKSFYLGSIITLASVIFAILFFLFRRKRINTQV